MTYLLDVNMLLALCDPRHVHHDLAHRWFVAKGKAAWATCPIVENGLIRIASHPSYPNSPGRGSLAANILRQFCQQAGHHFWPDDVSLMDERLFRLGPILSANHTTDVYLLGLAIKHGGKLATLDGSIPTPVAIGGEAALELVATR